MTGYSLELAFAFEDYVRYRVGEYYLLYPCKHPLPLGVQVFAEYIDEDTKEVWIFDPEENKTLMVFIDKLDD